MKKKKKEKPRQIFENVVNHSGTQLRKHYRQTSIITFPQVGGSELFHR